jgi:hypothetical protein
MGNRQTAADTDERRMLVKPIPGANTRFILSKRATRVWLTAMAAPARDIPALRKLFASASVLER